MGTSLHRCLIGDTRTTLLELAPNPLAMDRLAKTKSDRPAELGSLGSANGRLDCGMVCGMVQEYGIHPNKGRGTLEHSV